MQNYLVQIVRRTREHPSIAYGASRSPSVALCCARRRSPPCVGREFATPDDVRDITRPFLRHRCLRAEAELDGATPDGVITDLTQHGGRTALTPDSSDGS